MHHPASLLSRRICFHLYCFLIGLRAILSLQNKRCISLAGWHPSFGQRWITASPEADEENKPFNLSPVSESTHAWGKPTDIQMKSLAQRTLSIEAVIEKSRSSSTGSAIGKLFCISPMTAYASGNSTTKLESIEKKYYGYVGIE